MQPYNGRRRIGTYKGKPAYRLVDETVPDDERRRFECEAISKWGDKVSLTIFSTAHSAVMCMIRYGYAATSPVENT